MAVSKKKYTSDLICNSLIYSYGFDVLTLYSSRLKLDILLKHLQKNYRVLDAGCANGLFSFAISTSCKEVHGIDINEQFLIIAREKAHEKQKYNLHFIFGDVENIPFAEARFDCIFSYSCLVLVEDVYKALEECVRVVKKDGYLILDITGKHNLSQSYWRNYYAHLGHHSFNAFSYNQIENFCNLNQMKIIETHALGFLDQWKYIPIISKFAHKLTFLDKLIHGKSFDLDYFISNLPIFKHFANRWYIVCQKI
ncbi:MAG: 2-methoxy-6-polyprenyl-1,4-benzoquinol methylase, mitochondrial [Holosporales bacterium]